ncbi:formate dehydrogenase accessory protein FdhE [Caldimonas thermodepolymerans]|jgi:formate dehydrogenase accessory protein FdhE|uniref:Protein FdhE homolog n=1 Tax=Caldimonas thermodepolymerans TaxID=215580 RepID=A0AA46DED9_9BURK|nr:formate dehydrogenase accessory protein FdhE [Caldimonas thermodepolymerans]TCP07984.1 Tat proofreading chaperone FdhE [Caldimonas thermodepolymerans]UZG45142.1 formate dehydrogenase accessory protein FdhE [Caldimonas thermodepolymerans]UZG48889.1 formate dehydrogenase accessory protein FdhE [Caldimonas thermodepolymerans]
MTATGTVRVMPVEEIVARGGGNVPYLAPPARGTVFAERGMRLRQLAASHAMGDFLRFMADVSLAQQELLNRHPEVPLPDAQALDDAARCGVPPLSATDWPRDAAWRQVLRDLVTKVRVAAPEAARPVIDRLLQWDDVQLERQADGLLHGVMHGLDLATAPLVAAALQVHWTHLVIATQERHQGGGSAFGRLDDHGRCPCCGSRPTASVVRPAGDAPGQRYLHCSLCSMQWHMVRARCTHCGATGHIAYESLEAADAPGDEPPRLAAVQAETCDDCGHYLKIVHTERDPFAEPVADDLATLTLDLLVCEAGRQRYGVNLMLLYGEPEPPGDSPPTPGGH